MVATRDRGAVTVRAYEPADAEAVCALLRAEEPQQVATPRSVHAQAVAMPARQHCRLLVALLDGRIAGCARTGLFADAKDAGAAFVNINVAAADRGRGAGRALLAAAETHLDAVGATTCYAWAHPEPGSENFATAHGYRPGREARFMRLDLGPRSPLPARPRLPRGVLLLPAVAWERDPRPLWRTDVECFRDEPGDVAADHLSYTDWRTLNWDRPDFDADLTTVAVVDGEVAGLVIAQTDGERHYASGGTGIRRAFRGRGLAKAAKAHSLHLARAKGYREASTTNDDGNAPMLAVNIWLGYQLIGSERRYIRDLSPGRPA
ncbi:MULTISPECIES: GNAT family N-acetyltransferase [Streptomycetaceae]|uniref:GNAT family N-acetyltransferase n=1 Tax=Streptomycetaceae TaxID=2062 RepID=UPI00300A4DEE